MVVSERRLWNKTTTEVRFYLSSLASNAEKILKQFAVIGVLKIAYIGHEMLLFLKTRVAFVKIILLKILLFYVASAVNLLKQEKNLTGLKQKKRAK
jgi:hypothetical protein